MRRYLALLIPLLLFASVGCDFRICNGTGDTLEFHIDYDEFTTLEAGQCDTITMSFENLGQFTLYARRPGQERFNNIASRTGTASEVFTFNGIRFIPSTGEPDLSSMSALQLCNESSDDVQILAGDGDAIPSDGWIVAAGTSEPFITVGKGFERFVALSADGKNELGECEVALVDGVKVVWNGVELKCDADDPPDPTAVIELRNDSPIVDDVVLIVLLGEEPGDLDAIDPGNFRFVEYPTGAPLIFQAFGWDLELQGQCTLNDPSFGDQVIWDGTDLFCIDP